MRLRVAMSIYSLEGPHNGRADDNSARAMATRVVHAYLTPGEVAQLGILWSTGASSKGNFLGCLQTIRERLTALGEL